MNIMTRKCDACGARHDSDQPEYGTYGHVTDGNEHQYDVCAACLGKLFVPGGPR